MKKRIRMMKILAMIAMFSLAAAFVPLHAQTIEVTLLESAGDMGAKATRSSEIIISGVLDGLFDAGFIGTNARPLSGTATSFLTYVPGADSAEGFVDFVIVVFAEYSNAVPVPVCGYRLIRVSDGREMARGTVPAVDPASSSSIDIDKACVKLGKAISAACGGVVRGVSSSRRKYGHEKA
jgi:hypothetical protein